ncbi:MAG: hypothetical protein DHS20C18_13230 [Saprospiraceae bacterium]|nr:MAG: hypothetical protein DHS20C18_13230 [Saprospiraceae bacterium]
MENKISGIDLKLYFRSNWIKIALALLLLFIILKKDLSFQINLNAPDSLESVPPNSEHSVPLEKPVKRETFTEARPTGKGNESIVSSVLDQFDLSGVLGSSSNNSDEFWALETPVHEAFIRRFVHVAENENVKYKIPASVILGNALLISRAGEHPLVKQGNNHFALPCTKDWQGETANYKGECFRKYENAWTSFRDHSLYLSTYLFAGNQMPKGDYKQWAKALENAGFGGGKGFANNLVRIIEHYQLNKFDD